MTPDRDFESALGDFIDARPVSFLSSVDGEGRPVTRAMLPPCCRRGIRVFYYHTNTSSRKVAQFRENPGACLYFCDEAAFIGLMLQGEVEVLEDAAAREDFWRDEYRLYYPGGVADPDYCLLKFTARSGRRYGGDFTSEAFSVLP